MLNLMFISFIWEVFVCLGFLWFLVTVSCSLIGDVVNLFRKKRNKRKGYCVLD